MNNICDLKIKTKDRMNIRKRGQSNTFRPGHSATRHGHDKVHEYQNSYAHYDGPSERQYKY